MKAILFCACFISLQSVWAALSSGSGIASWYGEEHRGKLMANGKPFNPDHLTAASWFYPLGTKVRVSMTSAAGTLCSVLVSITDRGPARSLVRGGRIIDLSRAAFDQLAPREVGLIQVRVEPVL